MAIHSQLHSTTSKQDQPGESGSNRQSTQHRRWQDTDPMPCRTMPSYDGNNADESISSFTSKAQHETTLLLSSLGPRRRDTEIHKHRKCCANGGLRLFLPGTPPFTRHLATLSLQGDTRRSTTDEAHFDLGVGMSSPSAVSRSAATRVGPDTRAISCRPSSHTSVN